MNEETLIWLFGILGVWCLKNTIMGYYLAWQMKKIRLAVELFITENGKGAAIILHSPDDHLGLDALVDKYVNDHQELSRDDWIKLGTICQRIKTDKDLTNGERMAATTLMASFLSQLALKNSGLAATILEEVKKAA